ncbi:MULTISPECIES: hypothetical protein [unclassified Gordonia (in: high G+C Gram-positive bacteria)]|uniref:hypothetical protein n=1 Tax=unclassified Gordonia (in: high G+C Gram-positive bacteria) TaxID=2657482 RepID=UPI001FFF40A4|nr:MULTISPECIES: hypothetical protein [unclassified Gordonia (in: high G+C Gram-positive bacteria)]UQE75063.1 hypothetical protein MYK68_20635 [Gordonia sp. PP30]
MNSTDPPVPGSLPEPPFTGELLAEYDAGALPPELTAHITARLGDDPGARRILDALALTRADLARARVEPVDVPPAVDERLRNLLRGLGNTSP